MKPKHEANPKLRKPRKTLVRGKGGQIHSITDFHDRILTDMRRYFRYMDWPSLWEEWFHAVTPENHRKYRNVAQFAKEKAESKQQYHFLVWYLGPRPEEGELDQDAKLYPFLPEGPVDWVQKRNSGGWYTPASLKKFSTEIQRRDSVLDIMQETGRTITLHSVTRAEQLAQAIDKFFNGAPMVEGLSMTENLNRAKAYIGLQEDVLALQERAFTLFAKSHGVNFDDMEGLVHLMQASAMAAAQRTLAGKTTTREQAALQSVVEMVMTKSARYNLPIPPEAEGSIQEAVVQFEAKKKRNNLQ